MIRIPEYLAVAQWALLGALGVLVVIMFRQLGRLLTGAAKIADLGPPVGSQAAALTYTRPGDPAERRLTPGRGQPLLLAFVDPTCPSCEELVGVLGQLDAHGELSGVRTLLLISDPPSYLQISDVFSATGIEITAGPGRLAWSPTGSRRRRCWSPSTTRASCGPPDPWCGQPRCARWPSHACCRRLRQR